MQKLKLNTKNLVDENIQKLADIFPNVVKEGKVDFELLKQMLSDVLIDGCKERYGLNWVGKRESILKANTPINKTLRPIKEKSVDFENTKNVYIEGDNFEALKIIQESYLTKIKMIYIDPPYNTGTAMIYKNDYSISEDEYQNEINAVDEEGVKLFKNTDSNGRFHSDWLNMMYERLLVARDLLREDGLMIMAIDHNELHNLIHLGDEVFGETNRLGIISVVHKPEGRNQAKFFGTSNEYMIFYAKNKDNINFNQVILDENLKNEYPYTDEKGNYKLKNFIRLSDGKYSLRVNKPDFWYPIFVSPDLQELTLEEKHNYFKIYPITDSGQERTWKTTPQTTQERIKNKLLVAKKENNSIKIYEKLYENQVIKTHWIDKKYHGYHYGTKLVDNLLGAKTFDFPKSLYLIIDILKLTTSQNDIILDFFSGSATTAHAVMELNAEDGGNRQFIMVQIPEIVDEKSEAYKAGFRTIAEIGRERIIRAAEKIKSQYTNPLDFGFRYFKVDTSNFKEAKDISEITQENLFETIENIKPDRNDLDLLFEVILNLGLELTLKIETKEILDKKVYFVEQNSLIACFDDNIDDTLAKELATYEPLKVVLKDSSFKSDSDKINFEQTFKELSPESDIWVV